MNTPFSTRIYAIFAVTLSLCGSPVSAAVFNITNGDIAGLNAAITIANGNAQDDTINLARSGSYVLTVAQNVTDGPTGLAVIQSDGGHALVINGNGALLQRSTASGTPNFRILNVASGNVTILNLSITNGKAFGMNFAGDNSGGGIFSRGTLALRNCILFNNAAVSQGGNPAAGGAIFNFQGSLILIASVLVTNSASGVTDFEGGEGGALYNLSGTADLIDTTVDSNSATRNNPSGGGSGGFGGGIVNSDGMMGVRNCTINSNSCTFSGAGIANLGSSTTKTVSLVNTTISNNVANGSGGGIFNQTATLNLTNTTISSNSAVAGGGVYTFGSTVRFHNTIVAGNAASSAAPDIYAAEAVTSEGHNLIGIVDSSSGWVANDLTGTSASPRDPMLLPLAANGGPTQTRALQASSPAVNAGDNAVLFNVNSDQRLFARKAGAAVDIGAFEYGASPLQPADLNGDSFIDYLLFNSSTRRTALWYLRVNTFLGGAFGPILPPGWQIAAVADMNRSGSRDLILFNASTRQTAVWYLRSANLVAAGYGPTLPSGWTLVAARDMNQDGWADYILFNPTTRQTAVWFLNGRVLLAGAFGPTLPVGWKLTDALDFNGDGKPDYSLFNPTTRQTAIWYLNGTTFAGGVLGPTLPAGWTLQGGADFNGDGKPDYALFNPSTRQTAIWYLNGAALAGGVLGPTLPPGYGLASP